MGADPDIKNINGQNGYTLALQYNKSCIYDNIIISKNKKNEELQSENKKLEQNIKILKETNTYLTKSIDESKELICSLKVKLDTVAFCTDKLKNENEELKDN